MTEGLGPVRLIVRILRKSHLSDSSSCDFENPNKNLRLASQNKCDKMISDPIWSRIIYFNILLFSYVPGLYIFLIVCGNYQLTLKRGRCRNLL